MRFSDVAVRHWGASRNRLVVVLLGFIEAAHERIRHPEAVA